MKKKIQRIFLILQFILIILPAKGQFDGMNGPSLSDIISIKNGARVNNYLDIKGSPYASDSFKTGIIYTTKGEFKRLLLRHDLLNGWVELLEKGKILILSPEPTILQIDIDTSSIYVHPYFKEGRMSMGFFTMLAGGRAKLLKQQSVFFIEKPPAKALEFSSEPAKFERQSDKFFVRFEHMEAKTFYSVKKLISMAPDHNKELESYVKAHKTGMKPLDLIQLIGYYNTLMN